jgi:hypothetical protein
MIAKYHIEITHLALQDDFSSTALETIIAANIKQDKISHMIGHDHIHFDGNAFERGFKYIADQEHIVLQNLQLEVVNNAWQALGRICHSWQDYFSHSNYVELWANNNPNRPPEEIVFDEAEILNHPDLSSGKIYALGELLSMMPGVKTLIKPFMPADSHARMNLDSPSASPYFYFAYWAAYKATCAAFEKVIHRIQLMDEHALLVRQFRDK